MKFVEEMSKLNNNDNVGCFIKDLGIEFYRIKFEFDGELGVLRKVGYYFSIGSEGNIVL